MKRSLIAISAVAVVAIGVAAVSGAFSSGGGPGVAAATPGSGAKTHATMPMPAAKKGSPGPLSVELHNRVVHVKILNFAFVPARIEVSPGTRVIWTNQDSDPHTVTTDKPGFSSQALDTGKTYVTALTKDGTFAYHCTIHPFMHGTVTVVGRPA